MIKIIKENRVTTYQWTCKKCKSIFQFDETDCTESFDRSSRILEIKCPVCGSPTWSADPWKVVSNEKEKEKEEYKPPMRSMYHENGMPIM